MHIHTGFVESCSTSCRAENRLTVYCANSDRNDSKRKEERPAPIDSSRYRKIKIKEDCCDFKAYLSKIDFIFYVRLRGEVVAQKIDKVCKESYSERFRWSSSGLVFRAVNCQSGFCARIRISEIDCVSRSKLSTWFLSENSQSRNCTSLFFLFLLIFSLGSIFSTL